MAAKEPTAKIRIQRAYFKLLTKKHYLDITVSDIVNEAEVGRASFYRAFTSMDDMINTITDAFYRHITTEIAPMFFRDREKAWKTLLNAVYTKLKTMEASELEHKALPENAHYMISQISRRFEKALPPFETAESLPEKYIPVVNIHVVLSIGAYWIHTGFKESVDEIAALAWSVIRHNLEML